MSGSHEPSTRMRVLLSGAAAIGITAVLATLRPPCGVLWRVMRQPGRAESSRTRPGPLSQRRHGTGKDPVVPFDVCLRLRPRAGTKAEMDRK